jgi:23S rRNA (cytosine1962-C5)-methyltransferase
MTDGADHDALPAEYALVDVGGGARLERFGERLVDRPSPGALGPRRLKDAWLAADLRFDRDRGWSGPGADADLRPWPIRMGALTLELRPTDAGQVGLFPEHESMAPWLLDRTPRNVLNLFAYTGLLTLALAAGGASVTHVDAARGAIAWARQNAHLSGLADRPLRWIVDDATTFVAREARRGRRYDGVILDPPTYGHGTGGRAWRLEEDAPGLLEVCRAVLEPGGFVLLTAHTPGMGPDRLGDLLATGLRRAPGGIESGALGLSTGDGRRLELGAFARSYGAA